MSSTYYFTLLLGKKKYQYKPLLTEFFFFSTIEYSFLKFHRGFSKTVHSTTVRLSNVKLVDFFSLRFISQRVRTPYFIFYFPYFPMRLCCQNYASQPPWCISNVLFSCFFFIYRETPRAAGFPANCISWRINCFFFKCLTEKQSVYKLFRICSSRASNKSSSVNFHINRSEYLMLK